MHYFNRILKIKLIEYPLILIIFYFQHSGLLYFANLSENVYFHKSIFIGGLSEFRFLFLLLTVLISLIFFKKFNISWDSIDEKKPIKFLIMITAGCLVWKYSMYDFNYYFNEAHYLDRIIVIILYLLLWMSPAFSYSLVVYLLIIVRQFEIPLGSFSYTDIMPLFHLLNLFVSFLIIKQFKRIDSNPFIILAISLHAANYFIPAMAKLEISPNFYEWFFYNNVSNLFVSGYINGWLTFLNEETVISIATIIKTFKIPLLIITFLVQFLSIIVFFKERITISLFIGFEALHIGIFLASGIFFWKWMLLNIGFIILVKKLSNQTKRNLFTKQTLCLSIFLIIFSPFYFKPASLAWYDTKVNNIFEIQATDVNGKTHNLSRNFFSPYDKLFTQNRFYYILNKPIVTSTYGTVGNDKLLYSDKNFLTKNKKNRDLKDFDHFTKIENSSSAKLEEIREIYGINHYSLKRSKMLEKFLKKYFTNYNKADRSKKIFEYLGSPYHINSNYISQYENEDIKKIELIYKELYYDGLKITILNTKKIIEILL